MTISELLWRDGHFKSDGRAAAPRQHAAHELQEVPAYLLADDFAAATE